MLFRTRSNLFATSILAGVALSASGAFAQTTTAGAEEVSQVVVTGTRILTNGNASPTPLTVVSTQQLLQIKPGSVGEALAALPIFSGSRTGTGTPGSGTSNSGSTQLDLRFLGQLRTLILFDGKRVPPSTFDQIVDTDIIPQMLLQRVDLVTGGASAIYGSDAVSGVVNFIPDTKFNGLKVQIRGGIADAGDDRTIEAGIAGGRSLFNDRGHIEFSLEYRNDPGISRRSSREWGQRVWVATGAGTAANPYTLLENGRLSAYTFGGLVTGATGAGAALNNRFFETNGVLVPFVNGPTTGTANIQIGGSGGYYDSSIKATLRTTQGFGRFDYELAPTVHAYVQGAYSRNRTITYEQYDRLLNTSFNGNNPFLPTQYQFAGTFRLSQMMTNLPRTETNTDQKQYFVIAGLDGTLGGKWKWDIALDEGHTQSTTANRAQMNNQKTAAALDAVRDPSGAIVCRVTLTNPGLYPGCVAYNPFGPNAASQAAIDYILSPSRYIVDNNTTDVSGNISGELFNNWAGPVQVAVSGEWRKQSLAVSSNALPSDTMNCTGLTLNCAAGGALWFAPVLANLPKRSLTVSEAAIETEIPLLKDVPLFQSLSFNGAVRYAHYSTSGSAWTWKAGLVWQVNDQLKLRGTRSRDFRAPTLYDLFQPNGVTIQPQNDILTNIALTVPDFSQGNPNLKPEIGNTETIGLIYQPSWLPRFSLSIDAFNIHLKDAITTQSGSGASVQGFCYASGGSSIYCTLQSRPLNYTSTSAANAVTAFYTRPLNIDWVKTYGADFEANYATSLFGNALALRGLLTWQPHIVTPTSDAGGRALAVNINSGRSSSPRVRASAFVDYTMGPVRVSLRERWRSHLSLVTARGTLWRGPSAIGDQAYTDATLTYTAKEGVLKGAELYLNVVNLFDTMPQASAPAGSGQRVGSYGGFTDGDDPIGRYFNVGARYRF